MTTLLHNPVHTRRKHSALKLLRGKMRWLLLAMLSVTATVPTTTSVAAEGPLVALASSFRDLWPELLTRYTADSGASTLRASFASSGLLGTQIRHGAPFELFVSADETTVDKLVEADKTRDAGVRLAYGTLSLVSLSHSSGSTVDEETGQQAPTLDVLREKREQQQPFRLAIPNPRHAPYGVASQEALQNAGLWPIPAKNLLNAENASQTLQFALSGAVDYAIVPDTLLLHAPERLLRTPLPEGSYHKVVHRMILMKSAGPATEHFYNWLQDDAAAAILSRYGLTPAR